MRVLRRTAWRSITQSSQPARRRRPVTVPNSRPMSTSGRRRRRAARSGTAGADAGGVRLGDADDAVDVARPEPGAGARPAGRRVRRRDVRIGAVVEVEERRLGPFEQQVRRRRRARRAAGSTVSVTYGARRAPSALNVRDDLVDVERARRRRRRSRAVLGRRRGPSPPRRTRPGRARHRRGCPRAGPCRRRPGRCPSASCRSCRRRASPRRWRRAPGATGRSGGPGSTPAARSHETPRASSVSISANSVGRSTTTPLPITGTTWS